VKAEHIESQHSDYSSMRSTPVPIEATTSDRPWAPTLAALPDKPDFYTLSVVMRGASCRRAHSWSAESVNTPVSARPRDENEIRRPIYVDAESVIEMSSVSLPVVPSKWQCAQHGDDGERPAVFRLLLSVVEYFLVRGHYVRVIMPVWMLYVTAPSTTESRAGIAPTPIAPCSTFSAHWTFSRKSSRSRSATFTRPTSMRCSKTIRTPPSRTSRSRFGYGAFTS